jgi:hypothetical protein
MASGTGATPRGTADHEASGESGDGRVSLLAGKRSTELLPKNPVRQAMDYALSNWMVLCRYVESGWLDIDNNVSENVQWHIALGRKNWLFCGSDGGGRAAAIFFSLIVSCKRHHLDPFAYLHDILIRLPAILAIATLEELIALLPHRWQTP